ncbi:AraC family transcriptional regulator [Nannocystis sp. ILAH1]|uniref:helix-turn-helix domain-containing protein n=1 Tax=Nannocystis sp. ILAH1 TaxID=2996789 RepID=UPI00226DB8E7|nr:AraC family transcriptional regulator [Nannocystis sp. ILAH1]MCY0991038.1 AraC family transcriptional regulator [Nannocystis sp. ILAH1]
MSLLEKAPIMMAVADPVSPFTSPIFPVGVRRLAAHPNPALAVLVGRTGPVTVANEGGRVTGEALIVRPAISHCVSFAERGADVIYLNGLAFSFSAPLAVAATGALAQLAARAIGGEVDAIAELRARLGLAAAPLRTNMAAIVRAIQADPMTRMSQTELARRLGMERTQALRRFKAATGLTFRAFKLWSGLQHAARQIEAGALVRTAAMDAGFADTAHLSRSFRAMFGLSPSAAIAGLGESAPSLATR